MKVYPVPGRLVRDPLSRQPVPPEGREVAEDDPFWFRRLQDGDVTTDAPDTKAPEKERETDDPPQKDREPIPPRREA